MAPTLFKTLWLDFDVPEVEAYERLAAIFEEFSSRNAAKAAPLPELIDDLDSALSKFAPNATIDSAAIAFFENLSYVNYGNGHFRLSFTFRSRADFAARRLVALARSLGVENLRAPLTDDSTGSTQNVAS